MLEGEEEAKRNQVAFNIDESLAERLLFEWDRPGEEDEMKRRHEAIRSQESGFHRSDGFLPTEPGLEDMGPLTMKIMHEKYPFFLYGLEGTAGTHSKYEVWRKLFEDELNRLRKRWLLQENGTFFLDNGSTAFFTAGRLGFSGVMKQLLQKMKFWFDVNVKDTKGNTALMLAFWDGQGDVAEMLLEEKGINVNLQDQDGNTALMLAISQASFRRWGVAVKILLNKNNIEVNQQNYEGDTALMMAVQMLHENIVTLLLKFEKERDQ